MKESYTQKALTYANSKIADICKREDLDCLSIANLLKLLHKNVLELGIREDSDCYNRQQAILNKIENRIDYFEHQL